MPEPCPELVFVSGPQEGERAVLIQPAMLVGRAETCDVRLAEEATSREHLRFEMTPDGCQMEVLSARGVRVNGKAYKPPRKILLETGDCLFLGAATLVLFVSAGDDPEEAISRFRKDHPAPRPVAKPKAPEPAPPPAAAAPPPLPKKEEEAASRPGAPRSAPAAEDARQEKTRQARRKKFIILGGVYAIVLVGIVLFLNSRSKPKDPGSTALAVFTDNDIADALRAPLTRSVNPNIAAEELSKALTAYDNRNFQLGNLQRCLRSFKLHLAYLNRQAFDDPENSRKFQKASDELIAQVQANYVQAWLREKDGQWSDAGKQWDRLRTIVPHDAEWNTPGYDKLVRNVMDHAAYCHASVGKKR